MFSFFFSFFLCLDLNERISVKVDFCSHNNRVQFLSQPTSAVTLIESKSHKPTLTGIQGRKGACCSVFCTTTPCTRLRHSRAFPVRDVVTAHSLLASHGSLLARVSRLTRCSRLWKMAGMKRN